jgi:hypothetical protein
VQKIRESDEYKKDVRDLVKSFPAGMNRVLHISHLEFRSGDLYAAAKKVEVTYDGYVCRPIVGADRAAINVVVFDTYDFAWWSLSDAQKGDSWEAWATMTGNNLAYLDQTSGIIKPFKWEVRFKESGRWKR